MEKIANKSGGTRTRKSFTARSILSAVRRPIPTRSLTLDLHSCMSTVAASGISLAEIHVAARQV